MAEGVLVTITENAWVKVATNIVTSGKRVMRDGSFGTAVNPAKSSAGSAIRSDEVILAKGKKYLLAITNKATSDNPVNIAMSRYEE